MSETEVSVHLCDRRGQPVRIGEVHVDLLFYTGGRFRYSFSFGRTDTDGVCRTTVGEIERQLRENQQLFLMDYNTPLEECDTLIGIVAPTADELVERQAVLTKWWPKAPSIYSGTANERVQCREQKFEVRFGRPNVFELVCEAEGAS